MGIHLNLAVLLADFVSRHGVNGRVATLGEQSLSFDPEEAGRLFSVCRRADDPELWCRAACARFFALLGFTATESIDIDGSEGATHLLDLNLPETPPALVSRFDLVLNAGTLEHVFHVPNALAQISRMLTEGGVAVHVSPCNNWVDHGFYQFNPTLMFDYYSAAGFECLESMLLGFTPERPDDWFVSCAWPGLLGGGLAATLDERLYLHLFAARRGANIDFHPVPIQSIYVGAVNEMVQRMRPRWFTPFLLRNGVREEVTPYAEMLLSGDQLSHEAGNAWTAALPELAGIADNLERPGCSPLILLEDGVPLGPAHSPHAQIRATGWGRYSHWGENLYLSASDNSAPPSNGRSYVVLVPAESERFRWR